MEPALDPTQLDELRAVAGGDEAWFSEILQLYLETAKNDVTTLVDLANGDDAEAMERAAHRVKGQSSYLGARALTDLCKEIMTLCKEPADMTTAKTLVPAVTAEFARVEAAILKLLSATA